MILAGNMAHQEVPKNEKATLGFVIEPVVAGCLHDAIPHDVERTVEAAILASFIAQFSPKAAILTRKPKTTESGLWSTIL